MIKSKDTVFAKYQLRVTKDCYLPNKYKFLFHIFANNNPLVFVKKGCYYYILHVTSYRFERLIQKLRRKYRFIKIKIFETFTEERV